MSGINGDKARFHRRRKQKIARRIQTKELFKNLSEQPKPAGRASGAKEKEVSA